MFTGMARIASNGTCSSLTPGNVFNAGAGMVTVTLTQATAPRMQVQICATMETDHTNCTVPPFALLTVGQSLSATLRGAREQAVTLYPEGCGGPDSPPSDPVSYTVSVVYPR